MAVVFVADLFGDVLDIEGLLGGDPENIILGKFAVCASDSFA